MPGLKSPQEMNTVDIKPEQSGRFTNPADPKIDTKFADTLSAGLTAKENQRQESERKALALAEANFENAKDSLRIQAQAKIADAQGLNAGKVYNKERESFETNLGKAYESVPERFRPAMAPKFNKGMNELDSFGFPHVYQQVKKVELSAFTERAKNDTNLAIEMSHDLDTFEKEGLASVRKSYYNTADRKGLFGVEKEKSAFDGVSSTIQGAIEMQVRAGYIPHGKEMLNRFNEQMTPADKVKAWKAIDKAEKAIQTREDIDLAQTLLKHFGDDLAGAHDALKTGAKNPTQYKNVSTILKNEYQFRQETQKSKVESIVARLNKNLKNTGRLDTDALTELAGEDYKRATEYQKIHEDNKGQVIRTSTDWEKTYPELRNLFDNNPEKARDLDLHKYWDKLSSKEYARFEKEQSILKRDQYDDTRKVHDMGTKLVGTLYNEWVKKYKIFRMDEKGKLNEIMREESDRILAGQKYISAEEYKQKMARSMEARAIEMRDEDPKLKNLWGVFAKPRARVATTMNPNADAARKLKEQVDANPRTKGWPEARKSKYINFLLNQK